VNIKDFIKMKQKIKMTLDQYYDYLSRVFIIETPKFFICSKCNMNQ